MAKLKLVSGVGGKDPAAFLVEAKDIKILFDIGEGPAPGKRPDFSKIGKVDAVFLTHAHHDHVDSIDRYSALGEPYVYATNETWKYIREKQFKIKKRKIIGETGSVKIKNINISFGKNGHSQGGVWFHVKEYGGILYMGDWSKESLIIPFDEPPKSRILITDFSYGLSDENLLKQIKKISGEVACGAVLPIPPNGRGADMALGLLRLNHNVKVCPVIHKEIKSAFRKYKKKFALNEIKHFRKLLKKTKIGDLNGEEIIISTDATADSGCSKELLEKFGDKMLFIFTGHLSKKTTGSMLVRKRAAKILRWNAHPRFRDNLTLIKSTKAEIIIPAFSSKEDLLKIKEKFGKKVFTEKTLKL